jgi:hypothetical protein
MRSALFWPVLLFAVLVPALGAAEAWPSLDEPPEIEPSGTADVAVLVAIEDYVFMPDVTGARENLAEWETLLRDGLGVETVLTLVNEQGVREQLIDIADRAVAEASPESTVWFVFIGHGAPSSDGSDGFLVGADAQQTPKSIATRSVRRTDLLERLEAGPQKRTVVLFDACFSGTDAEGKPLAEGIQPVVPVEPLPIDTPGTVVLSAAGSGEYAGRLPGVERPAFSYLVAGGLRGWADDGDGHVTAAEAVEFARRELLALPGRRQTPQAAGLTNAILTTGATEDKPSVPRAQAATDDPVSGAADEPTVVHWKNGGPVEPSEDQPSLVSLSAAAGLGGELGHQRATPVADVLTGFRFTSGSRFRGTVGVSYFNRMNPRARALEEASSILTREFGVELPEVESGEITHLLGLTVGPGFVHRPVDAGLGLSLDGQVGLAVAPMGQCSEWDERYQCRDREGVLDPLFGLRAAGRLGLFEVAAVGRMVMTEVFEVSEPTGENEEGSVDEVAFNELYLGMTLGMTFDL